MPYQSILAGSRTPSLQRPSECVQQEPAHLRRPGPEGLSFRARLQPENQKLYAPDYRRENHLPVQGQHPGRESPETAERIPAGRHTACQGGGSEPVVSGTAREKTCQRNGGCVLFRQVGPHPHTAGILPTSSAYKTPVCSLDLTHSLQLQGWADYDWLTLLRHIHAGFYGLLCLLLAATGIQVCLYLKKRQNKPEKGLYIDLKQQILLIDGMQCAISSLDLQLLYLLWEKKGECVNREDLKTACWPHDPQADEKLDAHIQTIRKVLQDFPDYRISTAKGRGYYLTAASC